MILAHIEYTSNVQLLFSTYFFIKKIGKDAENAETKYQNKLLSVISNIHIIIMNIYLEVLEEQEIIIILIKVYYLIIMIY